MLVLNAKERALQGLGVAMLGKLGEGSCRLQGQSEPRLGVTGFKVHDLSEISRRVGPTYALEGLCWPKQLLQTLPMQIHNNITI